MITTGLETIPSTWDDQRDEAFFRITRALFSASFTFGAGVLLSSYDVEPGVSDADLAAGTTVTETSTEVPRAHLTAR
jgi:hypothetical protein